MYYICQQPSVEGPLGRHHEWEEPTSSSLNTLGRSLLDRCITATCWSGVYSENNRKNKFSYTCFLDFVSLIINILYLVIMLFQ